MPNNSAIVLVEEIKFINFVLKFIRICKDINLLITRTSLYIVK